MRIDVHTLSAMPRRDLNGASLARPSFSLSRIFRLVLCLTAVCAAAMWGGTASVVAQSQARTVAAQSAVQKLPSPEKIVSDYVKKIGGKKRLAAVRDATYMWKVYRQGAEAGTAKTQLKAPSSSRTDIMLTTGEIGMAAGVRSAWIRDADNRLRTLTDTEAFAARLQASLEAGRMVDYKKQNVLARTVSLEDAEGEQAFHIEFSTRTGARLNYRFGATSKLLLRMSDEARGLQVRYADWRASGASSPLEPHRIEFERRGTETLTFVLNEVRYNTGAADTVFNPPGEATLDIPALLREVARNQDEIDGRISEYTFTRKQTEREINDRGEVKKEKSVVHEVYPVAGGGRALKLLSENGVPLSLEKRAREEKRVAEEIEKLERENEQRKRKLERERTERARKQRTETGAGESGDDELGIGAFLRACEFVSPRRENFREREAIVFDFRPRANFQPSNDEESIIAKLSGTIWIDPLDRQVMRLEARLDKNFKIGGGLVASVRPGSTFAFEQARMADGVWLPKFSQVSASAKVFLFAGFRLDATREYADYKRFSTKTGDATLDEPKEKP